MEIVAPGYVIRVDVARRLVTLKLLGFWTVETFDEYTRALKALAAKGKTAGRSPEEYSVLVDLREHGLQSKEVAARIEQGLAAGANRRHPHAVLVSPSVLHKAQAQRIGAHIAPRFFADEEAAMRWLMAGAVVA
ncbi:hypothetical protein [Sphingomonas sp. TREG-RG-20F-R18-01]|uniref:hypothetical protein n=1 Tax=Sphingomonas sp. TREG-RG-20F-R18-01 TaxID=2914982 RepID=UPI001F56F48F|nr:hypothetical protein [Sphingomonas sp. TREG-RG-20F-R18-01]